MARGKSQRQEIAGAQPKLHRVAAPGELPEALAQQLNGPLLSNNYKPVWLSEEMVSFLQTLGQPYGLASQDMLTILLTHAKDYPDEIHRYIRGILRGGSGGG